MAIAAHPGDALFTMGAAVAQHIHAGGKGVFLSLTLGEKGAPKGTSPQDYGELQRKATERAAAMLRAQVELLDYPDAELPLNESVSLHVCDLIRKHKPDVVITHWSGTWHKDHQNCHIIVRDAIFYADLPALVRQSPAHKVDRLYYADNWEDATNFQPDTYLDISPIYRTWMEACELYPMWRGQTGFFRYNDYYSSLAVMRGCLSGFRYAAALMTDPNQRLSRVRSLGLATH